MENVVKKIIERLPRETTGNFEASKDALKYFQEIKETKKNYTNFLKDIDSISEIIKLIKNKKLSNNQIKNKIREFLNDPEDLKNFLMSLLDENNSKKEETKEAMGASSGGSYSGQLYSTTKGDITNKVKTVREESLKSINTNGKKSTEIVKKQHNLKKIETKEATTSSSSGQYSQPSIWAKSMSKKNWRGYSKPIYKGGKFVQVKEKCKKFPYCNQGDINALKIFENYNVQKAIDNVINRFNIDREYVSNIVFEKIKKTQT